MDDRKAILNLSTYFPNDSEEYLRRMYRKHNCEIEATIKAIYEDKLQGKKSRIRRFLESFWNPFLKYCRGPKIDRWSPPGSSNVENPGPSSSSQDEVFFEINIGKEFAKKLEEKFADPTLTLPEGFQPVIEIPVALGRQLYVAYIESIYRQQEQEGQAQILNQLDKEDEEFVKELQLQQKDAETGSGAISQTHLDESIPNKVTGGLDKEFEGQNTETKKSIGSKRYLKGEDRYFLIDEKKESTGIFQEDDKKCLEEKQVLKETEALGKTLKTKGQVEVIKASALLRGQRDEEDEQFKEKQQKENQVALSSKTFLKSDKMSSTNMEDQFYEVINEVEFEKNKKLKSSGADVKKNDPSKVIVEDKEFVQKFQEKETELATKKLKYKEHQDENKITSTDLKGHLPTWDRPINIENKFTENQPEIKDVVTSKTFSKESDKIQEVLDQELEETEPAKTLKNEEQQLKNINTSEDLREYCPIWDQPMEEESKFKENQPEMKDVITSKPLSDSTDQSYELINEVTKLARNNKLKKVTVTELKENQSNRTTKNKSTLTEKKQDTKGKNTSKQITKKKGRKQKNEACLKLQEAALKEYQTTNQLTNKNKISSKGVLKEVQEANCATSSKENYETSNRITKKSRRKKGKRQGTNGLKASKPCPKQRQNVPNTDVRFLEATNSEVLKTFQFIRPGVSATNFKEEKINSLVKSNTNTTGSHFREKAQRHLEERQKFYQKAQYYLKTNKTDLAEHYFQQARKQRDLYEENNRLAAAAFLAENRQQNPVKNTIDLHYLYVKEAIEALDAFLDDEISSLENKSQESKSLMIITGRGKHSNRGIPRIKPSVIKRLEKRQLRYSEMNPGLLKVRISQYSCLTNELDD